MVDGCACAIEREKERKNQRRRTRKRERIVKSQANAVSHLAKGILKNAAERKLCFWFREMEMWHCVSSLFHQGMAFAETASKLSASKISVSWKFYALPNLQKKSSFQFFDICLNQFVLLIIKSPQYRRQSIRRSK